jgi:hypothetical protein
MIHRTLPEYHSLLTRVMIFTFLALVALCYGMEQHMETTQQAVEIDYN